MINNQLTFGQSVANSIETALTDQTVCSYTIPENTVVRLEAFCILQRKNSGGVGTTFKLVCHSFRQFGNAYIINTEQKIQEEGSAGLDVTFEISGTDVILKTTSPDTNTYRVSCNLAVYSAKISGDLLNEYSTTFDGINEYISMNTTLNIERTQPFSMSIWVKTTLSATGHLIGKIRNSSASTGYALLIDSDGKPYFDLTSSESISNYLRIGTTSATVNDGSWHHLVVTYDGSSDVSGVNLYIDNAKIVTLTTYQNTLSSTTLNTGKFSIGRRILNPTNNYPYTGNLDEASIWNKELSSSEINNIYNSNTPNNLTTLSFSENLLGWWRMGDNDTHPTLTDNRQINKKTSIFPTIGDLSNENDGTMTGMNIIDIKLDSPDETYCKFSIEFNGFGDFVTSGNVLDFDNANNDPFSVSFWVKTTDHSGYIVSKMTSLPLGYGVFINSSGEVQFELVNNLNRIDVNTSTIVDDGNWYNVITTYDGSQDASGVTIYINDTAPSLTTTNNSISTDTTVNSANFNINGRTDGASTITSRITEVSIYNKELSPTEVSEIYNSGSPINLKVATSSSNLVGWWRMGNQMRFDGAMASMDSGNIVADVP